MLRFFRRIRKSLFKQGNTGRYLIYALGEIILVVLGILIALQINNWNEWRKNRITEAKFLVEVKENLEFNSKTIQQIVDRLDSDYESSEIIIAALNEGYEFHDSLGIHFARATNVNSELAILSIVGYESLNGVGFDHVLNESLKKEIKRLYEYTYGSAQGRHNRVYQYFDEVQSLIHKHLMRQQEGYSFIPYDYENLVKNKEFKSWLNSIRNNRIWIVRAFEECLRESQRVLDMVKQELNNLE